MGFSQEFFLGAETFRCAALTRRLEPACRDETPKLFATRNAADSMPVHG